MHFPDRAKKKLYPIPIDQQQYRIFVFTNDDIPGVRFPWVRGEIFEDNANFAPILQISDGLRRFVIETDLGLLKYKDYSRACLDTTLKQLRQLEQLRQLDAGREEVWVDDNVIIDTSSLILQDSRDNNQISCDFQAKT